MTNLRNIYVLTSNFNLSENPFIYHRPGADLGLKHGGGYTTTDVFTGENLGSVLPDHQMHLMVNPNGELLNWNPDKFVHVGCAISPTSGRGSKLQPTLMPAYDI